jgi:transcriptional regulator with XRE-family HTH domain
MQELMRLNNIDDLAGVKIDHAKLEAARGKLTRQQVAEACGVGYTAIYNIETGANLPSADLLAKLCTLYNKDLRDLVVIED